MKFNLQKVKEQLVKIKPHLVKLYEKPIFRNKFFLSFTFLIAITFAFTWPWENDNQPSFKDRKEFREPQILDPAKLHVLEASPQGDLNIEQNKNEVVVVFNHAMVPLAKLEKQTKGVFTISPKVKGKFRWYGSRICAFIPDKPWDPDTNYKVNIDKKISSLNGKKLDVEYNFNFKIFLEPLQVTRINPNTDYRIKYKPEFVLTFNYDISIVGARRHIKVVSNKQEYPLSIYYESNQYERSVNKKIAKNRIKVTVKKNLPIDSQITVKIEKSLQAQKWSKVHMSSDKSYQYMTYGDLKVELANDARFFSDFYSMKLSFNHDVNLSKTIKSLRIKPKVRLNKIPKGNSSNIYIRWWDVKPGKSYTLTIPKVQDVYGNRLKNQQKFEIEIPNLKKSFSSPHNDELLEALEKPYLPINVSSLSKLTIKSSTFSLADIQEELNHDYQYNIFDSFYYSKTNLYTKIKQNQSGAIPLDISSINGKKKFSWNAIQVGADIENWNGKSEYSQNNHLIQKTDLGITAKDSQKSSYVWIHSLQKGTPQKNVQIEVYNAFDKIGKCTTNQFGFCMVRKEKHGLLEKALFYAKNRKGDQAFVSQKRHRHYSSYNYYATSKKIKKVFGEVFFDRRLYRPGEEVSVKAFLAENVKGKIKPYKKQEVEFTVTDSKGQEILTAEVTTSKQGGIDFSLPLTLESPLGHYSVRIKDTTNDHGISQEYFQVEEFEPATFSVQVNDVRDMSLSQKLRPQIQARYLFGAPMQNAPFTCETYYSTRRIYFDNFNRFVFGDYVDWYEYGTDYQSLHQRITGELNNKGEYRANLSAKANQKKISFQDKEGKSQQFYVNDVTQMKVSVTVADVDETKITNTKELVVYPGKFLIGMYPETRYQNYKKTFRFNVVALDNKGKPLTKDQNVNFYLIQYTRKSIKSKAPGSSYQSRNTVIKTIAYKKNITISGKPEVISVDVPSAGEYRAIVWSENSKVYSRTNVYAYGDDFPVWSYSDDDSVKITTDRSSYKPGEIASILIQSPFTKGQAILTLEREDVLWHKTINFNGELEPIQIPIKENYLPNVYFTASLVRSRIKPPSRLDKPSRKNFDNEDLGRPLFKFGKIKIRVDHSSKKAKLELKTSQKVYAPGDSVSIEITSEPNSEVVLTVADRGILDLINYTFPNPVNQFYRNWPHEVNLYEARRHLVKQYKYASKRDKPGGAYKLHDGGDGGFDAENEDGLRKNFKSTAYWNPSIKTDKQGKAQIKFQLPDNLTTFRVMAAVSANGKYHREVQEIIVQKSVVVQKMLPRFIRPSDVVRLGAVLVNQTNINATFITTLKSNLLFAKKKSLPIILSKGSAQEFSLSARVNLKKYIRMKKKNNQIPLIRGVISIKPKNPGLFIKAGYQEKDFTDKIKFSFPVREERPQEAFSIANVVEKNKKSFNSDAIEKVTFPRKNEIIQNTGKLRISLATTALTGLDKAFRFYESNPFQCLEQRGSAFLLSMSAGKLYKRFSLEPKSYGKNEYDFDKVEDLFLDELSRFQNDDGGFKLWPESSSSSSNPYLTAYVLIILYEAKQRNYDFDNDYVEDAIDYLKSYYKSLQHPKYSYTLETLANMQYALSLYDESIPGIFDFLWDKKSQLPLRAKLNLLLSFIQSGSWFLGQKKDYLLQELKNSLQVTTQKVSLGKEKYGSYQKAFYTEGSVIALALKVLMRIDRNHPYIPKIVRYLVAERGRRLWLDSHSIGHIALSLDEYHNIYEKDYDQEIPVNVLLRQKLILKKTFPEKSLDIFSKTWPLANLLPNLERNKPHDFLFSLKDFGRLYYQASLIYQPINKTAEPRDEGIEISRKIASVTQPNKTINTVLDRGELYLYQMRLTVTKPSFQVLIQAPVPSHVEIVNTSFATENQSHSHLIGKKNKDDLYWWESSNQLSEYRDDRIVITESYLRPGIHEYTYLVRPTLKGRAIWPATSASLMYEPEVFGYTASHIQIVK